MVRHKHSRQLIERTLSIVRRPVIGTFLLYGLARIFLLAQAAILTISLDSPSLQAWAQIDSLATLGFLIGDLGVRSFAIRCLSAARSEHFDSKSGEFLGAHMCAALGVALICTFAMWVLWDLPIGYSMIAAAVIFSLAAFGPVSLEWRLIASGKISMVARNRMIFEGVSLCIVACFVSSTGLNAYALGSIAGVLTVFTVNRSELQLLSREVRFTIVPFTLKATFALCLLGVASHLWLRIPVWLLSHREVASKDAASLWLAMKIFLVGLEALSICSQIIYPKLIRQIVDNQWPRTGRFPDVYRIYARWSRDTSAILASIVIAFCLVLYRKEILSLAGIPRNLILFSGLALSAWVAGGPYVASALATGHERKLLGIVMACGLAAALTTLFFGRDANAAAIALFASSALYMGATWLFTHQYMTRRLRRG